MRKINIIFDSEIFELMTYTDSILYADIFTYLPDYSKIDTLPLYIERQPEVILPVVEKKAFLGDWSVILIIIMLSIIASVKVTSEKYLYHLFYSIFNAQTASRLFRERVVNILHPAVRLEILFYLSTGLFILQIEKYYLGSKNVSEIVFFILNSLVVFIYVNAKYLLYVLNGFLFKVQMEVSEYVFYSKSGNKIMGLFLFPIAVLLFFSDGIWHEFLLLSGLFTIIFFSGISLFKGIKIIAQKDFSIYYMIIYLCTLEILPLLIVWRILRRM